MNYIYTITERENNKFFEKTMISIKNHCDCKLILSILDKNLEILNIAKKIFNENLIINYINKDKWNGRRMCYKIENILNLNFQENDNVFVLDDDLIIQDDIFQVFEKNFDICITSRHYNYWYLINGGVWGFKYNENSQKLIKFFISQIHNPTWSPLIHFRNHFCRSKSLDWWVDQDFLCVIKDNELPFNCKIIDIGYEYNFCPSVENNIPGTFESASKEIISALGNKDIKILHFKGKLKELLDKI